ncbi:hypothetical protein M885DRAFT_621872 [Pelagophyceae sp. CCMP2097]|nr:hypothetical protein M885DRAFT_621872 [Pelagophyceae sp. CCMP2097]
MCLPPSSVVEAAEAVPAPEVLKKVQAEAPPLRKKQWRYRDIKYADVGWTVALLALAGFLGRAHQHRLFASCVAVTTVVAALSAPVSIYFQRKHQPHRLLGLFILVEWVYALVAYFLDYDGLFAPSVVIFALPLTGLLQSMVATKTFYYLPKKQTNAGYYSDASALSWNFVAENQYFAGILLWQWVYMHPGAYALLAGTKLGNVVEAVFVALPYVAIRPFTPRTHFRDALRDDGARKSTTLANRRFFHVQTWVTKIFYIFAKHYIGYFLNYLRYLNKLSVGEIRHIYLMLIFSVFATTISMFLHTLKFRGYMGPRTSFFIYQSSYMATFYSWYKLAPVLTNNLDFVALTAVGVFVNFKGRNAVRAYQFAVLALITGMRLKSGAGPFGNGGLFV